MKKLKKPLIIIAVIIVAVLGIALLLPGKYVVTRKVTIARSKSQVFALVGDLRKWHDWSAWAAAEPKAPFTYSDNASGVKAWMSWEGKEIGTGKLSIIQFAHDSEVGYKLDMAKPYKGTTFGKVQLQEQGDSVTVIWEHTLEAAFPIGRYFLALSNTPAMLGKQFRSGLDKLKELAESSAAQDVPGLADMDFTPESFPTVSYVGKTVEITDGNVYEIIFRTQEEIKKYLETAGIPMVDTSSLVAVFVRKEGAKIVVRPGIVIENQPVSNKLGKDLSATLLYSDEVIRADVYGDPMQTLQYYKAIRSWMKDNGYLTVGQPWEVFLNGPWNTDSVENYHTVVYYPVRKSSYNEEPKAQK